MSARLERYLDTIERERQTRPAEAMLADEIHRLRAVHRSWPRMLFGLWLAAAIFLIAGVLPVYLLVQYGVPDVVAVAALLWPLAVMFLLAAVAPWWLREAQASD